MNNQKEHLKQFFNILKIKDIENKTKKSNFKQKIKSYCNSLKKQSSELKKTNINKYKGDDLFEIKFNGRGKNSTYGRRKK